MSIRPGKAVRKAFKNLTDGQVQSLTQSVSLGHTIVVSGLRSDFIEAYNACESCMAGNGELIAESYRGASIALLLDQESKIIARCLVLPGFVRCPKIYGGAWYMLDAWLASAGFASEGWDKVQVVPVQVEQTPAQMEYTEVEIKIIPSRKAWASSLSAVENLAMAFEVELHHVWFHQEVQNGTWGWAAVQTARKPKVVRGDVVAARPATFEEWFPYVDNE